jgi:Ala-tRNA(Pro) deacylase
MTATTETAQPLPELLGWLREHEIDFELHEHTTTYTARATARAEGVDPQTFAKTLGVVSDDGRRCLVVLDATDQLDLARARRLLNARHVRLLREDELAEISPAVEVGALPPVPLWHLPIYADYAVRYDPEISFPAGTHAHAVRVDREAWEASAGVIYGDLAMDVDGRPIWARS